MCGSLIFICDVRSFLPLPSVSISSCLLGVTVETFSTPAHCYAILTDAQIHSGCFRVQRTATPRAYSSSSAFTCLNAAFSASHFARQKHKKFCVVIRRHIVQDHSFVIDIRSVSEGEKLERTERHWLRMVSDPKKKSRQHLLGLNHSTGF